MAVLVTGGAGYIGSHMVHALIDAKIDVVVLDRLSTGFKWAVAPEAKFYKGDVGDPAILREIFRYHDIEAIIHFAGSVVVPDSVKDPLEYYENNTAKSRTLIQEAIRAEVPHFVFSSTAAVYGNTGNDEPVKENIPLRPESPYGFSKLMTEVMLRDTDQAYPFFSYAALRYFNVAGADPLGRTGQSTAGATHLIKTACEVATGKRDSMDVYGTDYPTRDGTCIRDYIHVSDLVEAHLQALRHLRDGHGSIVANVGYGKGASVLDVINSVQQVSGKEIKHRFADRREGDPVVVVSDNTRAVTDLNWKFKYNDLDFIVKTALSWEKILMTRQLF